MTPHLYLPMNTDVEVFRGRRLCYCHQADRLRLAEIVLELLPEASHPKGRRMTRIPGCRGLPKIGGTLFENPYNRDPVIWGTILGFPVFRNPHMVYSDSEVRFPCKVLVHSGKTNLLCAITKNKNRSASMLKVRPKTLVQYKEASSVKRFGFDL